MKFEKTEKDIQELKKSDREDKYFLLGQMIQVATQDDDYATNLARKVLRKDIKDMILKLEGLFQRKDANFEETAGRTDIDILIDWLRHIDNDDFIN